MHRMQTTAWLILIAPVVALAADWPQWRGPGRNGVAESSPPLAAAWPDGGPPRLWLSEEEILGGDIGGYRGGGFGSVAVAGGRVYCCSVVPRPEKLATRTLAEKKLIGLGWAATRPPADVLAAAEQARLSAERDALQTPADIQAWATKWLDAHLSADQRKQFAGYLLARLKQGKQAIGLELLDRLETIKDKPFPGQDALDAWLTENHVEGDLRKRIGAQFPDTEIYRDTVVLCMDAATGKTVWKKVFTGGLFLPLYENVPSSGTPCVAGGRVYLLGTNVQAFCLDAATGERIWDAKIGTSRQRDSHCSFLVADGVAAVAGQPVVGFDAETGRQLWTDATFKESWSSPALWRKDGKAHFIFRDGVKVACLDAKSGAVLWSVKDFSGGAIYTGSTPAVAGDLMALAGRTGVRLYKLSAEKAELLWDVDCPMDYCSGPTIYQGHVYAFGRGGATCINLESSQVAWQDKQLKTGSYHSPLVADGKFFVQGYDNKASSFGDGSLSMVAASPQKGQLLAQATIRQVLCTSAAFADGRLFCRLAKRIVCYDLRPPQD